MYQETHLDFNHLPHKSVFLYLEKKNCKLTMVGEEYCFKKENDFYFTYDEKRKISSVNNELVEEISKLFTVRGSESKELISSYFASVIDKPVIEITSFFMII